jgi:hypothetical protein
MTAQGFHWPELGYVESPDWSYDICIAKGLYGFLWSQKDYRTEWQPFSKWLVVSVEGPAVELGNGMVKFRSGNVLYSGTQTSAVDFIKTKGVTR